jgi:hypothetical protein
VISENLEIVAVLKLVQTHLAYLAGLFGMGIGDRAEHQLSLGDHPLKRFEVFVLRGGGHAPTAA